MILQTQSVTKVFSGKTALENVSISVPRGSIYGLLGPNGAGKTTLIRMITQITAPDNGSIYFDGRLIQTNDIFSMGYLPEERGLYRKMKVGELALYLAQLKGLSKEIALIRLKKWFQLFEIEDWRNKKIEVLSKGMQQKLQFIVTVLHEPKLLIFDEPFSGFDPINAEKIKNEIIKLKNNGATVIFSTHNMASVEELCSHLTLINNGKDILSGEVNAIKKEFAGNMAKIILETPLDTISEKIPPAFLLCEQSRKGDLIELMVKMPQNASAYDLLSKLEGNIISYQLQLPSMNDIFITAVNSNNQQYASQN